MTERAFNMDSFFGGNTQSSNTTQNGSPATGNALATPSQVTYYLDLCKQKGIEPNPLHVMWSKTDMSAEMKVVMQLARRFPISENQIKLITDICARNEWEVPANLTTLTGGKEGTASTLINELLAKEKGQNESTQGKPTTKQLQMIADMQVCPEFPTVDELLGVTLDELTPAQASEYIKDNSTAFYDWKRIRLSPEQANFIKTLQQRVGDVILTDAQIIQFDTKTAGKYIDQLQKELQLKERVTATTLEPTIEEIRKPETDKDIREQAYADLIACVHRLYAMMGQQAEDDILSATNTKLALMPVIRQVRNFASLEAIQEACDKVLEPNIVEYICGELL